MSALLTTASVMTCPHGGTVTATSSNTRVNAGGSPILRSTDTFVIAGCPFVLVSLPHPCVTVQWLTQDLRSQVLSDSTLSESSVGLCLAADQAPQGSVLVMSTQEQVNGQ
jgi:hypothetical protein